jgi:hypothetical protein
VEPEASPVDLELAAQAAIERCMAERGFVYVPDTASIPEGLLQPEPTEPSLEQVERHGYGLADAIELQLTTSARTDPGEDDDPNATIRDRLPPEELEAYQRALTGLAPSEVRWRESDGAPLDPITGAVMDRDRYLSSTAEGCTYQAYAGGDLAVDQRATELYTSTAYQAMQAGIRADPRIVELADEWVACMAGQGYDYRDPEQPRSELQERGDELLQEASSDQRDLPLDDALEAVDQLRAEEIRIAVADWGCSADLLAEVPAIAREHEVRFIEENEGLVVALLDERDD